MAVYKVPQDVEADDKLIGPFSFRQFIYLIIVAIGVAGAWGLSQLFIPLAIVPLPIIVFFAALALPLRKDQPMEAYLSAVVSFYFLKSRKRFWIPDGIDSFVTIIPPKDADKILTKDLDEAEATKRLGYLADLVDTHGWAIRGAGATPDTSISTDLYYESQQTVDMMDSNTDEAKAMAQHLQNEAAVHKQEAVDSMKTASQSISKTAPSTQTENPAIGPKTTKNDSAKAPAAKQVAAEPAKDAAPRSTLPSIEEIRAKTSASQQQHKRKDSLDAIALANALTEQADDERSTPVPPPASTPAKTIAQKPAPQPVEKSANTSVSTPATGTIDTLTHKQADELSQLPDKVSTIEQQAQRIAQKNKVLKDGDEVTISFH